MISLCMIVKNEEHNLARCLNSVDGCVDEIIIVDTGSTDKTVEIAKGFGAKIYYYQWDDDFAAARNTSLSKAKGDWLLYLDADEELEPNCSERLRSLESLPGIEGFIFQINNVSDNNDPLKHINLRMFRNRPEYRFEGKLHEQIMNTIIAHNYGTVVNSGINIFHYGYLRSEFMAKDKANRNYRINKKLVESEPTNPFYLYTLGGTCINLKDYAGAADCYQKALDNVSPMATYTPSIYVSYISCLLTMGRLKEALEKINECKGLFPEYVDIHYIEGEFYRKLGLLKRAVKSFESCLQLGEQTTGKYTTRTGVGSFLPLFELAEISQTLGNVDKAISYQLEGLKLKSFDIEQINKLIKYLGELSLETNQIIANLRQVVRNLNQNTQKLIITRVLCGLKEYQGALSELAGISTETNDTAYLKGLCLAKLGRYQEVLEVTKYISDNTSLENLLLDTLISCWETHNPYAVTEFLHSIDFPNKEWLTKLIKINRKLLDKTSGQVNISDPVVNQLIGRLLTQRAWQTVLDLLRCCGMETAISKIAYLSNYQIRNDKLELAGRLALQELKNGSVKPDYYYVLGWYFLNNNALPEAHSMANCALAVMPEVGHYRKLLLAVYRRQALQMVQTALDNYPDSQIFLGKLLDIQKGLLTETGLKGAH